MHSTVHFPNTSKCIIKPIKLEISTSSSCDYVTDWRSEGSFLYSQQRKEVFSSPKRPATQAAL